jgi:hypothetical protein
VAHDTFLGTGVGGYAGLSASLFKDKLQGSGFGVSASLGVAVDPFGGTSLYGGIGGSFSPVDKSDKSTSPLGGGIGLNFNTNFKSLNVGGGAGISVNGASLIGASLSSGNISTSGPLGYSSSQGYNTIENANVGRIQTKTVSSGFSIPFGFGSLSIRHNYTRYWSDETSSVQTFGTLHYTTDRSYAYNQEYDTYYLPDINDTAYDLFNAAKNDPIKSTGGTLPDYDTYSVLGQGISGAMRPYAYQLEVKGKGKNSSGTFQTNRQNVTDDVTYEYGIDPQTGEYVQYEQHDYTNNALNPSKLNFRFSDDFSNRYLQQNLLANGSVFQFDLNPVYGLNDSNYGFDSGTERLASSRNIEYFTNSEILGGAAKQKGFINTHDTPGNSSGFNRAANPNGSVIAAGDNRIGGFMITNSSGVTYHYALPVYAYGESSTTENVYGVQRFNTQSRDTPYATSWLLTAVTGPDYVDINNNGLADQGDWGYWVDFEYGKWNSDYVWRTPYSGAKKDIDQSFQYHSTGHKELYYLDAIVTPTHTALFSKEIRNDGSSAAVPDGVQDYHHTTAQMRLNDVILFNNKDLNKTIDQIRAMGTNDAASYVLVTKAVINNNDPTHTINYVQTPQKVHNSENVIDWFDILALNLNAKVIRDVKLTYDYSLCQGTPNGFNTNYLAGKLTLTSLTLLGKQGQASIPPTTFDYDLPAEGVKSASVNFKNRKDSSIDIFYNTSGFFIEGDMIKFSIGGVPYYGLVKNADPGTMEINYVGDRPPLLSGSYTLATTKNPPYGSENHDMWGMYKADYHPIFNNENLARWPSRASAKSSDVWSLRRIHHSLGMTTDIVYEPDVYGKSALYQGTSLNVNKIVNNGGTSFTIYCVLGYAGGGLDDFIKPGDNIQTDLRGTYGYPCQVTETDQGGDHQVSGTCTGFVSSNYTDPVTVTSVTANTVTVSSASLSAIIFNDPNGATYDGGNITVDGIGNNYGGGLRIKQVINKEPVTGTTMTVSYNYGTPANPALSSGTTSYEPVGIDITKIRGSSAAMSKKFSNLLSLSRLVPGPGVMYEYVGVTTSRTVDGQEVQALGSSQYQFEVFNKGMLGVWNNPATKTSTSEVSYVSIQNYTSRIGSLKRIINYDNLGNKLSETINNYLYDEQQGESADANKAQYEILMGRFNKQGVIMERTAEGRYNDGKTRNVMTAYVNYPNIPTGSTTIDYKTGLTGNTQTLGFDMYSGQPVKTLTYDSYGNRFITEATPAYKLFPLMGLKSVNTQNANMLSQVAEDITYKADQSNNYTGVESATAMVWSNQTMMLNDTETAVNTLHAIGASTFNIWRPYQTYRWAPQDRTGGITAVGSFSSYFYGSAPLAAWTLTSQMTLYNKYSNALEAFDMNGNYGASKMDAQQAKLTSTATNANYVEMTYAGLEDGVLSGSALPRGVNLGSAVMTAVTSHTGNNSVQLTQGQAGLSYTINSSKLKTNRNFIASVWMKSATPANATLYYRVNSGSAVAAVVNTSKVAGDWYLVTLQIPSAALTAGSNLEVGCMNNGTATAYFDDFRFKPVNSVMNSYVYDAGTGELLFLLDNNNLFSKFQYDAEGRLTKTFVERLGYGVKQVNEYQYNYAH